MLTGTRVLLPIVVGELEVVSIFTLEFVREEQLSFPIVLLLQLLVYDQPMSNNEQCLRHRNVCQARAPRLSDLSIELEL